MIITVILRGLYLLMPLFAGAATRAALQAGMPAMSIFFANTGIGALAWYVVTGWTGGNVAGPLHTGIISALNAIGITGRGTGIIGYWMAAAALVSKLVFISIGILISPYIAMCIYWVVKSMNWSTYYLVEIYKALPNFVHNFFVFIHQEILTILTLWYPTVKETTTNSASSLIFIKGLITVIYRLGDQQWFLDWMVGPMVNLYLILENKVDPIIQWGMHFTYVSGFVNWAASWIIPGIYGVLVLIPGWVYELGKWMLMDNLFNPGWRQAMPRIIKWLFGW